MKTNKKVVSAPVYNHEGSRVIKINAEQELARAVLATFLFEDNFYENGGEQAKRIAGLIPLVKAKKVAELAILARNEHKLRHLPLFIAREMARHASHRGYVADVLENVIQRADELSEALAIYWKDGKTPIANQYKKGLRKAFNKFSEYQLSKYNRDNAIKLRDVLFLVHAKPLDKEQDELWKRLINDELAIPQTWENRLSASQGKNKKEIWTELLNDKELGGLAFLRNLRNMIDAGVDRKLIKAYFNIANFAKVLPFRFISAAKYAPDFEPELEAAMMNSLNGFYKLPGKTALVIDTSPSMWQANISAKSDINRFEAAAALAILARGVCEDVSIYAFNKQCYKIPPRTGFALRDALAKTQDGASCGGLAVAQANKDGYDRIIVLTDGEWHVMNATGQVVESADAKKLSPNPLTKKAYMINVANTKNGVGYGKWHSIDGFSEAVIDYIREYEKEDFSDLKD